jgi:hypothetical protein
MEHPLQLEPAHLVLESLRVVVDVTRGSLVAFGLRELEQLGGIGDAFGRTLDLARIGFEACALTPQLLSTLRLGPDGGVFQLAPYLFEALLLAVVLKETPVRSGCAPRGL